LAESKAYFIHSSSANGISFHFFMLKKTPTLTTTTTTDTSSAGANDGWGVARERWERV
jgi:Thr operon leader peptide